ncbi:MAG: 2OG-Fe(II) oxygenase, partial [Pseudomonadota bacterium]|nr:2OG-Fe(II) oxygenase [Pseudomonadota bacterium]
MNPSTVVPLGNPQLVASGSEPAANLEVGQWLDDLADGLSEHGWVSLDVQDLLGRELLDALASEVTILDRSNA